MAQSWRARQRPRGGLFHALLALALCAQVARGFSVAGQQESTCEANGSTYYLGEWYFLDSDHCTQCECTAEGSACARTECTSLPVACIHVSHYPSDCCPRCEKIGCEYRGVVYELGQNFQVWTRDVADPTLEKWRSEKLSLRN